MCVVRSINARTPIPWGRLYTEQLPNRAPGKKPLLLLGWDMPVAQLWRQLLRSSTPSLARMHPERIISAFSPGSISGSHRPPWARERRKPPETKTQRPLRHQSGPRETPSPRGGTGHRASARGSAVRTLPTPPPASKSPRVTYYLPHRSRHPQGPRSHSTPPSAR